ncbi:MAG: protease inhibitor I42 family protein [Syntrophorhabdaceae bacterium]
MKKILFMMFTGIILLNTTACTVERDVRISDTGDVNVTQTKPERDFADPAQKISVTRGETFSISLESNPTTGYSWKWIEEKGPGIVAFQSRVYEAPKPAIRKMAGVPGTERFTFKGRSAGKQDLTFQYLRPWEKDIPPVKTVTFRTEVE